MTRLTHRLSKNHRYELRNPRPHSTAISIVRVLLITRHEYHAQIDEEHQFTGSPAGLMWTEKTLAKQYNDPSTNVRVTSPTMTGVRNKGPCVGRLKLSTKNQITVESKVGLCILTHGCMPSREQFEKVINVINIKNTQLARRKPP